MMNDSKTDLHLYDIDYNFLEKCKKEYGDLDTNDMIKVIAITLQSFNSNVKMMNILNDTINNVSKRNPEVFEKHEIDLINGLRDILETSNRRLDDAMGN